MSLGKRFKTQDEEWSPEELSRFQKDGTLPEVDEDEIERARLAGWDLTERDSRGRPRRLAEVEEERAKRVAREEDLEYLESLSVEEHIERLNEQAKAGPG